jgi:hypothetical protein
MKRPLVKQKCLYGAIPTWAGPLTRSAARLFGALIAGMPNSEKRSRQIALWIYLLARFAFACFSSLWSFRTLRDKGCVGNRIALSGRVRVGDCSLGRQRITSVL